MVQNHEDLEVYRLSVEAAMKIFELTRSFPQRELYSLTDQIRRSSRSVSAQIAEAWRRRKYEAAFVNKLNEAEAEAAETQVWLEYSVKCGYLAEDIGREVYTDYRHIIGKLVNMGNHPTPWLLHRSRDQAERQVSR